MTTTSKKVSHWSEYLDNETEMTKDFAVDIHDHRETSGQVYIDIGLEEGESDSFLSVIVQVDKDPLSNEVAVPSVNVGFDAYNEAFRVYKVGNTLYLQLADEVSVSVTDMKGLFKLE